MGVGNPYHNRNKKFPRRIGECSPGGISYVYLIIRIDLHLFTFTYDIVRN